MQNLTAVITPVVEGVKGNERRIQFTTIGQIIQLFKIFQAPFSYPHTGTLKHDNGELSLC